MIRTLAFLAIWGASAILAAAQDLTALARLDPAKSAISDQLIGKTQASLALSQGVPFRVLQLSDPYRTVVDFSEVDFGGLRPDQLLSAPGDVTSLRFGAFRPGWSRLVLDLAGPMVATDIDMRVDASSGEAQFSFALTAIAADDYADRVTPPPENAFTEATTPPARVAPSDSFVVVIDPGHGGIDPGAIREGISEKSLMLEMALDLRDVLRRQGGIEVVLTRETDVFVSLPARIALAHQTNADVFVSLHADALSQGRARGATVYTLSEKASDLASEQLAAQHNRSDILAGVDLSDADDQVLGVLLDLARQETMPRTDALAGALVAAMKAAGGPINNRPRREAAFSVLKSADIPSVLVEVGFLSDARDLANLRDPVWRAIMTEAIATGVLAWRKEDLTRAALVRQ